MHHHHKDLDTLTLRLQTTALLDTHEQNRIVQSGQDHTLASGLPQPFYLALRGLFFACRC